MVTTKPTARLVRLRNKALLNAGVVSVWALFRIVRRFEPRFRRSLQAFDGVLRFRNEGASVDLVFADGNVSPGWARRDADFTIELLDLPGIVEMMKQDPGNMMRLLLENKITKNGNNYYLMKFGYLASLCERFVTERAQTVKTLKTRWGSVRA